MAASPLRVVYTAFSSCPKSSLHEVGDYLNTVVIIIIIISSQSIGCTGLYLNAESTDSTAVIRAGALIGMVLTLPPPRGAEDHRTGSLYQELSPRALIWMDTSRPPSHPLVARGGLELIQDGGIRPPCRPNITIRTVSLLMLCFFQGNKKLFLYIIAGYETRAIFTYRDPHKIVHPIF